MYRLNALWRLAASSPAPTWQLGYRCGTTSQHPQQQQQRNLKEERLSGGMAGLWRPAKRRAARRRHGRREEQAYGDKTT